MNRLSTLDWILSLVEGADFGVIFHLPKTPPLDALRAGSQSARTLYPVTGARIDGRYWRPAAAPSDGVVLARSGDAEREARAFMDCSFDPRVETPMRQLVVPDACIVTRAHHAAADGVSVGMWLWHQLRVAAGMEPPARAPAETGSPGASVRFWPRHERSFPPSAPAAPPLWTRGPDASTARRWLTIELPAGPSRHALAAAALRTAASWNRMHGARSDGMTLWLPVNMRRRGSMEFGNGTSRIRVGADDEAEVRRQTLRALRRGEWMVPPRPALMRLPAFISAPLLRFYISRPARDMGSVVFSYIEGWDSPSSGVFDSIERIALIGQLHRRLPFAINAIAHGGRIWMTFTYDPARLSSGDIQTLAEMYQHALSGAPAENAA